MLCITRDVDPEFTSIATSSVSWLNESYYRVQEISPEKWLAIPKGEVIAPANQGPVPKFVHYQECYGGSRLGIL